MGMKGRVGGGGGSRMAQGWGDMYNVHINIWKSYSSTKDSEKGKLNGKENGCRKSKGKRKGMGMVVSFKENGWENIAKGKKKGIGM